jgi:TatD DNase family protein
MIDFHCHLDLYSDPKQVAQECADRGLYVLSVTTTPSAWEGTCAIAVSQSRIRTALGLHPQLAHQRKSELVLFEQLLPRASYVGEVGLDGSLELKTHWADQLVVFNRVLSCCQEQKGRVISIHSRRAARPVLDTLAKYPGAGVPVLHWFSGSQRDLDRAIATGCWFSVGPAMLAGERGRALVSRMPRNRVLTETDGPFAQLDGGPAWPWDVSRAIETLASLWKLTAAEVELTINENLKGLLRLSGNLSASE